MANDTREEVSGYVMGRVQRKLTRAFWELDDVMHALSPDAPQEVADAWSLLYKLMTPELLAERDKIRGVKRP